MPNMLEPKPVPHCALISGLALSHLRGIPRCAARGMRQAPVPPVWPGHKSRCFLLVHLASRSPPIPVSFGDWVHGSNVGMVVSQWCFVFDSSLSDLEFQCSAYIVTQFTRCGFTLCNAVLKLVDSLLGQATKSNLHAAKIYMSHVHSIYLMHDFLY